MAPEFIVEITKGRCRSTAFSHRRNAEGHRYRNRATACIAGAGPDTAIPPPHRLRLRGRLQPRRDDHLGGEDGVFRVRDAQGAVQV